MAPWRKLKKSSASHGQPRSSNTTARKGKDDRPGKVADPGLKEVELKPKQIAMSSSNSKFHDNVKNSAVLGSSRGRLVRTWPNPYEKVAVSMAPKMTEKHHRLKKEVYKKLQRIDWKGLIQSSENAESSLRQAGFCGATSLEWEEPLMVQEKRRQCFASQTGSNSNEILTRSAGRSDAFSETFEDLVDRWISEESILDHLPDNIRTTID